jgi:hypothetical protein
MAPSTSSHAAYAAAGPDVIIVISPDAARAAPPDSGFDAFAKIDRESRRDRRAGENHAARLHRRHGAVVAEQYGFRLRRVDDDRHDHVALAAEFRGRRARDAAFG